MKTLIAAIAISFTVSMSAAHAASTDETPAPPKELTDARAALKSKDYAGAEAILEKAVKVSPDNADAWNLLGFATRKLAAPAHVTPEHLSNLSRQADLHRFAFSVRRASYLQGKWRCSLHQPDRFAVMAVQGQLTLAQTQSGIV